MAAATAVTSDDLVPIVNDPAGVPVTQRATAAQLKTFIGGGLSGAGSPEGVITANPGTTYWNTTAPKELWVKDSGTGNTGWELVVTL